ncbi:type II and III secretion system protein family protein [Sphingomonas sp.]|jgi:pilus assembly protein CpaC|uniref:type II and III secretion system protein family protein n=1 Tax=Sphingomonas sp. TaxID=28214 RepID=UPI002D7F7A06|nr:type II and III secretion system protein family protein [Sphingomonas sp.]HEU0044057.1 type II and III secretion system protein family protein [Sphingomonas sp.]
MRKSLAFAALPLLALGSALAVPASTSAQVAASGASPVLQVNTGRGRLITLSRPMSDLFIADDNVADVQVRSPTQLYIFGKKTGETTISATARGGQVVYAATVRVGNNLDSIGTMLNLAMPDAKIVATPMNGLVLLTGTVAGPEDAAEAERLVQAFVGDGSKVLSRLRSATPLQVNLQVRIAEVSRSFVKNIGANLTTLDGTGGFKFGIGSGRSPASFYTTDPNLPLGIGQSVQGYTIDPTNGQVVLRPGTTITPGAQRATVGALTKFLGLNILGSLDLGETIGQVSTLANPNLTALSGETATFLAGGEIPIPISQGLGAVSVEFKSYGISLAYTPTVLSNGRISLRVRPEVSQLSAQGSVQINGTTIPALTTRRAETTLELGSGQSMVIGGLLSNDTNNSIEKTPGLGDVPVLGALFRSNGWRRSETELMIVITPYLVRPIDNPGDIVLPTDGLKSPSDAERVLLGELGTGTTGARRPVPTMAAPVAPSGVIGAMTPAPALPAPQPGRRNASDERTAQATRKGATPMPGFSN